MTVIMLDNLNKADERSGKLEDLEGRADELLAKVTWGYFSQEFSVDCMDKVNT